ncbi:hypothetical protein [Streptomyces sp. LMG1-1-1.1]|uniref:hypothetical protein n=1 Tax=Streptomyces sp. LMG1-1-1.1 TaxID=3135245 RepID=UPI003466CE6F
MTEPDSAFADAAGLLGTIAGQLAAQLAEVRPYDRRQRKHEQDEQHRSHESTTRRHARP